MTRPSWPFNTVRGHLEQHHAAGVAEVIELEFAGTVFVVDAAWPEVVRLVLKNSVA